MGLEQQKSLPDCSDPCMGWLEMRSKSDAPGVAGRPGCEGIVIEN